MPASNAIKASKLCYVYVILKGKLASVHPCNIIAQDSITYTSEDILLLRVITVFFGKHSFSTESWIILGIYTILAIFFTCNLNFYLFKMICQWYFTCI